LVADGELGVLPPVVLSVSVVEPVLLPNVDPPPPLDGDVDDVPVDGEVEDVPDEGEVVVPPPPGWLAAPLEPIPPVAPAAPPAVDVVTPVAGPDAAGPVPLSMGRVAGAGIGSEDASALSRLVAGNWE
jgi:hypothetical protein